MELTIDQALQQGVAAHKEGKLQEAERLYRAILQTQPKHPDANHNLGVLSVSSGKSAAALPLFKTALGANPNQGQFWLSYIDALIKEKQFENAKEILAQGKKSGLSEEKVDALSQQLTLITQAEESTLPEQKKSLTFAEKRKKLSEKKKKKKAKSPSQPQLSSLLEHYQNGRYGDAEKLALSMTKQFPRHQFSWKVLGAVLQETGRVSEKLVANQKSVELAPQDAEAHNNLGITLKELGRLDEAEASYRQAISMKPDFAEVHYNLGNALRVLGRFEEAEASYRQAISLKPDYAKAHSNLLFLQSSCAFDSALYLKEALNYANAISKKISSRFAEWSCVKKPQRLRIGFVSGDFKNHPVGYFLEGLLTQLNPSSVELFAYPTHFIEDELTTRIKPCFASWTPLFDKSDKEAARLIHNDGVHILIDLSGHTANNRLPIFAWKPAPIQISWLGYWATTGVPEIDYVLGDPHVTPPQDDDHFTEKVWRLPETRWCFTPPDVDVEVSAPPALKQDYVTFGCFSNLTKINDKVVELWAKVLDAIPNSRLLLKAKQLRDQLVRESIIQRFAAQGINSKRISLEESEDRQKYFAAYNRIDITLDSFPFTGGTTSVESLWMGVPLITLAGDSLISRQGGGVLTNAGLPDWIADDEESYLAKAIIFASDLDKLARLRANLRSQVLASPLFDAPRFAQNFENALFEMWNQYAHQSRKKYP